MGKNTYKYWLLADEKLKEIVLKKLQWEKKCFEQFFGETLQQAMLYHIDIEEKLEELKKAESSIFMDINYNSDISNQKSNKKISNN